MPLFRAAQQKPSFATLWKLLADCCCSLHTLPPEICRLSVPSMLLGSGKSSDDVTTLDKQQVLALASRCYGMALKADNQSASLWHDLGVAYMRQQAVIDSSKNKMAAAEKQVLTRKAFQCVERAVQLDGENAMYWNTLGLVALTDGEYNSVY